MGDILKVINGESLILGRLATFVAKQALLGEDIAIVNSEKVVITGRKEYIVNKYKKAINRGTPFKGPFISRRPDLFLRRIIRGMLPYKKARGRNAFKRIKCYYGIPEELKANNLLTIEEARIETSNALHFITIDELCRSLGWKPRFERIKNNVFRKL